MMRYLIQQSQRGVPISYDPVQQFTFGPVSGAATWRHISNTLRPMPTTAERMTAERRSYSPKDIAEITGRHPESVRRHLRSGDLEGHKMGAEWIVFPDGLRDWLGDEVYENLFLPHEDEA